MNKEDSRGAASRRTARSAGTRWLADLLQDVRFAARGFRLTPGFTTTAVVTLGLGIAAVTTVMSIVDATLLRPLPFPSPDRVVYVSSVRTGAAAPPASSRSSRRASERWAATGVPRSLSDAMRTSPAFESVTEYTSWVSQPFTLAMSEGARVFSGVNVSPEFFTVFHARPARGRAFTAEDENVSRPEACILTSAGVRRLFNGQHDVVGRTVSFVEGTLTVVGVMDDRFWYPMPPDVRLAQGETQPDLILPWPQLRERKAIRLYAVAARLRPGATVEQAQREVRDLARIHGAENRDGSRNLAQARLLQEELSLDARTTVLVLGGLVGCLLLVCSVNIASLLVSRSWSRTREVAVRTTLGASRARLFRQFSTEYFVLAGCGGLVGLGLTAAALNTFLLLLPNGLLLIPSLSVDVRVLAIAGLVTLVAGLLSGLSPAIAASRADLATALKAGGQPLGGVRRWGGFRGVLLAAEAAVLLVLLSGGALLVTTLLRLTSIDLGFEPDRVWTAEFFAPQALYPPGPPMTSLAARMSESLGALPGVASVGESDWGLLGGVFEGVHVTIDGRADVLRPEVRHVSAGYFLAVGTSLESGSFWSAQDENVRPQVAVINRTAAELYWPGENPIGRRLVVASPRKWPVEVIGVVSDLREANERLAPGPSVYLPINRFSCLFYNYRTMVIRTSGVHRGLGLDAVKAMAAVDPRIPVTIARADEQLARRRQGPRFYAVFAGLASAFGLLLVAVGIAAVTAQGVTRRTREIGVRLALGASPASAVGLVIRQVVSPVLLGVAAGLAGALAVARVLQSFLYDVSPQDPATHVAAVGLLVAIAVAAAYLPARRAAKVDPVEALRAE